MSEEVGEQHRVGHVGDDRGVESEEHLPIDVARDGHLQQGTPSIAKHAPLGLGVGPDGRGIRPNAAAPSLLLLLLLIMELALPPRPRALALVGSRT